MSSSTFRRAASAASARTCGVDNEAGKARKTVEQGERGRRKRHRRHVVRHPCPQSDRRYPVARAGPLDGRLDPGRHLDGPGDEADLLGQLTVRGCRRELDRPRVGCAGGKAAEADHETNLERGGELGDGVGE